MPLNDRANIVMFTRHNVSLVSVVRKHANFGQLALNTAQLRLMGVF